MKEEERHCISLKMRNRDVWVNRCLNRKRLTAMTSKFRKASGRCLACRVTNALDLSVEASVPTKQTSSEQILLKELLWTMAR